MSAIEHIRRHHDELTAMRHDLHRHPELGLEEHRTAEIVAAKLAEWGIEVHRGVGRTGVVGVLRSGNGQASVGLRADMDALPIEEATGLDFASTVPGKMHACGHDGHTTMLLGAARYLAETRNFSGTVNFIFQPGEEGCGGALAMLEDGLFERFPCDAVFGMHNRTGMEVGRFGIRAGATAAGGAFFDITINGKGAHGARPEASIDPVLVACQLGDGAAIHRLAHDLAARPGGGERDEGAGRRCLQRDPADGDALAAPRASSRARSASRSRRRCAAWPRAWPPGSARPPRWTGG